MLHDLLAKCSSHILVIVTAYLAQVLLLPAGEDEKLINGAIKAAIYDHIQDLDDSSKVPR